MINRTLGTQIQARFFGGKTIVVLGPRQVGKTTLARQLTDALPDVPTLWLTGDDPEAQQLLANAPLGRLRSLIHHNRLIIVDEAQRVAGIGVTLKLIHDNFPDVQLLVTGSSALDLAEQTAEPLTGRKWEYLMLPLSFAELTQHHGLAEERGQLRHRLIFGAYPDVVNAPDVARETLSLLANDYLYKDLFRLEQLKKPVLLEHIVRALAFQVGSEVNYHEIGQLVGAAPQTVEKYIDLLEKAFIVFRLSAFSRNLRNEIKKSRKIYFWDNGIRNAVLGNFSSIETRTDVGALWENYLVSERFKLKEYARTFAKSYFWRTTDQQEVDYIEELDGQLTVFEFKWNPQAKAKLPNSLNQAYPIKAFHVVTPEQYDLYLMENPPA
jgi:uncharacterized protein